MWHEARKQEKMIRGLIVDYRRRAERRKNFYEKIKADPTQFLQLHGRPCKIHLDPAIAAAGEGPAIMMPWQGDPNSLIDRFDARAHLDFIPELKPKTELSEEEDQEERQCNYERYRILAQNVFLEISEDKFLKQLAIEEQFGVTLEEKESQREKSKDKKGSGVAIGYNYNDPGVQPSSSNGPSEEAEENDSDDESDLDVIDVDLSIDVNKMESSQAHALNAVGGQFGMAGRDLFSLLTRDADDARHQRELLLEEREKALYAGRKSRRERRAHRDKQQALRVITTPSYAAPAPAGAQSPERSPSRSPSPEAPPTIHYITSFGGDEPSHPITSLRPLYADKVKKNLRKSEFTYSDAVRKKKSKYSPSTDRYGPSRVGPNRPRSRSQSPSRSRHYRSRSRSKSRPRNYRSRSRNRRSRSRRKSRSYSRSSRSRSYSPRLASKSRNYSERQSHGANTSRSSHLEHNDRQNVSQDSQKGGGGKPVVRYYGRREQDKSSSELSLDSESSDCTEDGDNKLAEENKCNQNQLRLAGPSSKGPSKETLTLKERLKRKMQAQLSKQLRADKKAEAARRERESETQARRDQEMREMALKLRRRQRELRNQQYARSSDEGSGRSRSGSPHSRTSNKSKLKASETNSRSLSPQEKESEYQEKDSQSHTSYRDAGPSESSTHPDDLRRRNYKTIEEHRNQDRHIPERPYRDYRGRGAEFMRYEPKEYHRGEANYGDRYSRREGYSREPYSRSYDQFDQDHYYRSQRDYGKPNAQSSRNYDRDDENGKNSSRIKLVDY